MNINNDLISPMVVAPTLATIREGNDYLSVGDTGEAVLTCRKLLKNKGYSCDTTNKTYDATLRNIVKEFQSACGLTSDGYLGQATLAVLEDTQSDTDWLVNGVVNITAGKLARLGFKKLVLKPANVKELNRVCNAYKINTKTKVRHFLAQGIIETAHGTTFTETIYSPGSTENYADYAPYCGAGFIQLTWEDNYKSFYNYMKNTKGVDDTKIKTPSTYATQHVANTYPYESAGWFWHIHAKLNDLISSWAPLSASDTVKNVTDIVKGVPTDYETRLKYYEKSKTIFK